MRDHRLRGVICALVLATFIASSCGSTTSVGTASGAASETYGVVADPPLPIAAPAVGFNSEGDIADVDGSIVVSVVDGQVVFTRGIDGSRVASADVSEGATLRAVSADGTRAALFEDAGASHITVVSVGEDGAAAKQSFVLQGLVEPEAFSTDGTLLYVIDHQVAVEPGAYRVRPLNLATGELETILGPTKLPLVEDMNGQGRRQVWAPDGTRLYTLYIRQTHHHHADGSEHAHGEAGTDGFVHVLDLDEEWAFCLDLPPEFGAGELATTALAVSPDGTTLAIADHSAGRVAFASTTDLAVTDVVDLPDIDPTGEMYIALTEHHMVIGWGSQAHWFDTEHMQPADNDIQLDDTLVGFTSTGDSVLAWGGGQSEPATLQPPSHTPGEAG